MATWKSIHTVKWDMYTGFDYTECKNTWSYGTVSDFLSIHTNINEYSDYSGKVPSREKVEHYSKSEALGLLESLIDWAETYEGEGTVSNLILKIKGSKK